MIPPSVETPVPELPPPAPDLLAWDKAKSSIASLVADFNSEVESTTRRRNLRQIDIDVEAERKASRILADETMIPQRVIDNNIKKGMASYMNYTRQSRRLVIFTPTDGQKTDGKVEKLEDEFTRGMRYTGWDIAHEKTIDSGSLHGWGWGEVVYDPTKPLHVGIEYHEHERVIFPLCSEDVQANDMILVEHQYSAFKLRRCVDKHGWSKDVVDKLIGQKLGEDKTTEKRELIQVFKVFIKHEGQVFVGWANKEAEQWLKEPAPLDLNLRTPVQEMNPLGVPVMTLAPVPIEMFPVFMFCYEETERPRLVDHKGRAFYDVYKQEAQTAVWSAFVNACNRAAGLYGSVDQATDGGPPKQQKVVLKSGHLIDKKVQFWQPQYPDPVMLEAVQQSEVLNANETGQTTFAVMNKGAGSRTTAKEMSVAENDKQLLGSVSLLQLSRYYGAVYTFVWHVVQNLALQGDINFMVDPQTGKNDIETIKRPYTVQPAGDIDFIKREELKKTYMNMWSVVSGTPIALPFLARMLKLFLPEDGEMFADLLEAGNPAQLVGAMETIMEALLTPEAVQGLPPEQQQQIIQIMQQAKQYVAASNMGASPEDSAQDQDASNPS